MNERKLAYFSFLCYLSNETVKSQDWRRVDMHKKTLTLQPKQSDPAPRNAIPRSNKMLPSNMFHMFSRVHQRPQEDSKPTYEE